MNLLDYENEALLKIKERQIDKMQFIFYRNIIETLMLSKFKIKNLPTNIPEWKIQQTLLRNGICAITSKMKNGENYVGCPILTGLTEYDDIKEHAQLVNPLSSSDVLKIDKEIAVGYNNYLHTPELDIIRFAYLLAETDTSMRVNILNTRISPIFLARSENEKKSFEKASENIYTGKSNTIMLDDFFNDETQKTDRTMYLTEPNHVDKIQYLSKFHDDLIRRMCNLHGITMNTTGKMAQLTTSELNEYSEFSSIYIMQQYDLLCDFIEKANKIDNFNMSVELNDIFKRFQHNEMNLKEVVEEMGVKGNDSEKIN